MKVLIMDAGRDTFESFVSILETELATFTDEPVPLLSHQLQSFNTVLTLLKEDEANARSRSKQRRSEITRARDRLTDVFYRLGSAAFIVCSISLSISTLAKVKPQHFLPDFTKWWQAADPPAGLKSLAVGLCRSTNVDSIISSYRARQFPGLAIFSGQCKIFPCITRIDL